MLGSLPSSWAAFITTINNNDKFPTFHERLGKCSQEEVKMISRGRIPKHEEGEPTAEGRKKRNALFEKVYSQHSSEWTSVNFR